MKNYKNKFLVIIVILFAISTFTLNPSVSYASWWNPITWFNNWSFNPKVGEMEVMPNEEVLNIEQNASKSVKTAPTKPSLTQATQSQSTLFSVKDNLSSGVIDENTNVVLNLSFNGKMESDFAVSFKLVRDTDNRILDIEPGINFEYLIKNGGVYKPDMKRFIGAISYGQPSTTTYHLRADVTRTVNTVVNPTTVKSHKNIQYSANSGKFKIFTKPAVKSTISITSPNAQSVLLIGQTYNIVWTGSAAELSNYAVYLNDSSLGVENRAYLGSVNSSKHTFALKLSQNLAPGLYRVELMSGDQVIAFSNLFSVTNNPKYKIGSTENIDINAFEAARARDARVAALLPDPNLEKNCPAEGVKFFNLFVANKGHFKTDTSHFSFDKIVGEPQYHFNKSLPACLIKLTHTISPLSNTIFVSQIRDVYSTKLVTYGTWSSEKDLGIHPNREEFEAEARSLMTE